MRRGGKNWMNPQMDTTSNEGFFSMQVLILLSDKRTGIQQV
jgi:hypothetical protein